MVIQCDNKESNDSNIQDCNFNDINMKSQSANVLKALRKRKQQSMHNGMESLEILRSNIQCYFNDKISTVVKEFVNTFFEPAIVNIKKNTNESVSEKQMQIICKTMLENCLNQQYSSSHGDQSSSPCSSRNTSDVLTSDSDTDVVGQQTSLLHQALKRKRTESDNEQLIKQQFFLTKASNNYFSGTTATSNGSNVLVGGSQKKLTLRSTGSAVAAATNATLFTSTPKFVTTRSASSRIFSQSSSTGAISRPIFHIIQTPKNLVATHAELAQLLSNSSDAKKNVSFLTGGSSSNQVTSSNVVSSSTTDSTTVTSTQTEPSSSEMASGKS